MYSIRHGSWEFADSLGIYRDAHAKTVLRKHTSRQCTQYATTVLCGLSSNVSSLLCYTLYHISLCGVALPRVANKQLAAAKRQPSL